MSVNLGKRNFKKGKNMRFFAVKIQPDVRKKESDRYVEFPSPKEYEHIWRSGSQDGFHECVNFKNFKGKIKGYLPPSDTKLPEKELFGLVFVSSKANEEEAIQCKMYDRVLGIQVYCKKIRKRYREKVPHNLKNYIEEENASPLDYDYETSFDNSILLKTTIENASELIFPRIEHHGYPWGNRAVREIRNHLFDLISVIEKKIHPSQITLWENIKNNIVVETNDDYTPINDEIPYANQEIFSEGAMKTVVVNRYERDPKIKENVIAAYNDNDVDPRNGYKCQVCGFDFEEAYGELGKNFIEVHHIVPLSKIKKIHKVNPKKDLIPLCANCHAMIHRMKDPDYEELCDLYQERCIEKNRLKAAAKSSKVISACNPSYGTFHIRNLYRMFEIEANESKRKKIEQKIKDYFYRLPPNAQKAPSLHLIRKKFSL